MNKKIFEAYYDDKGLTEKQKTFLKKKCLYEKDIFNLTPHQYGDLLMEMCGFLTNNTGSSKNLNYLKENYWYLRGFFDWCVDKEYIIFNPFKEFKELDLKNLFYQFTENSKSKMISTTELDCIIKSSVKLNLSTYRLLTGLLFDGVKNNKELAGIKTDSIVQNRLLLPDRTITLSHFTYRALKDYNLDDVYYVDNRSNIEEFQYIRFSGFLVKRTDACEFVDDEKFIYNTSNNFIKNRLKDLGLSYIDINRSGMLHQLRRKFSYYSNKEFGRLFKAEIQKNQIELGRITEVGKTYGIKTPNFIISSLYPYYVKSEYFQF